MLPENNKNESVGDNVTKNQVHEFSIHGILVLDMEEEGIKAFCPQAVQDAHRTVPEVTYQGVDHH
jgi:hypothetical protein